MTLTSIETVLVEAGQVPLVIVHIKMFAPVLKVFTEVAGVVVEVRTPVPETTDQDPLPTMGVFALSVDVEAQIV